MISLMMIGRVSGDGISVIEMKNWPMNWRYVNCLAVVRFGSLQFRSVCLQFRSLERARDRIETVDLIVVVRLTVGRIVWPVFRTTVGPLHEHFGSNTEKVR